MEQKRGLMERTPVPRVVGVCAHMQGPSPWSCERGSTATEPGEWSHSAQVGQVGIPSLVSGKWPGKVLF